ncbi:MAG: ATP-binding protein, partial [Proteiniphilum sp.]|nr:ATP-binding protein [Proteiniphilum sp.]
MTKLMNPFVTTGYVSPAYFCDREAESEQLIREITNGNNIALISARRMGKTGLISHCFDNKKISKDYYYFFVDIYATRSLRDFVFMLSREILSQLKPFGRKALEGFWMTVKSLQAGISFNPMGTPSFNINLGDIQSEETTLEEIFNYLSRADKPCIVAFDEFQQIDSYQEKNVEELLRTHIQHCNNARFIFAGSRRHIMERMFSDASRPFYQSVSMLHLESIQINTYVAFARGLFSKRSRHIETQLVEKIYEQFMGVTWYMQKILNTLFSMTPEKATCTPKMLEEAVRNNVNSYKYSFSETLFRLPEKQKELLIAIARE